MVFELGEDKKGKVLVIQSCLALWDPSMDCNPPDCSVHGILHARTLEWVAIPSSRESSPPRVQIPDSRIAGGCFTIWATREGPTGREWDRIIVIMRATGHYLYPFCYTCSHLALFVYPVLVTMKNYRRSFTSPPKFEDRVYQNLLPHQPEYHLLCADWDKRLRKQES